MKERPILFSGEMIRTILDGRKTQTRRVIKPQLPDRTESIELSESGVWVIAGDNPSQHMGEVCMNDWCFGIRCPFGKPGDRLWVRETFNYITKAENEYFTHRRSDGCPVQMLYRADNDWDLVPFWKPSIFMPRWASRITLEITDVRVGRVQDIRPVDCKNEGIYIEPPSLPATTDEGLHFLGAYNRAFQTFWDSINTKRGYSWDSNPWVWIIGFNRLLESQPNRK
jgi:hypothetical protein